MRACLWCVLLMLTAACDDGARSRLEGSLPPDGDLPDASRVDARRDAADLGPIAGDDAARPPASTCRFDVEHIDDAEAVDGHPIVDGDTVYLVEAGPDGFLRTVRARDRAPVAGPSDRLLAARDGAFLLLRPDGDGGTRLIYRDASGDVSLGSREPTIAAPEVARRPPQWVEPGRAIFIERGRLHRWDGAGVPIEIDTEVYEALLFDERVAYAKITGLGVEIWIDGALYALRDAHYPLGVMRATASGLWFATDEAVEYAPWAGPPNVSFGLGAAAVALDAERERAVVVSERGGGRRLSLVGADVAIREIGAADTVVARLFAGGWLRADWPGDDAWCTGQTPGLVSWTDGDAVVELGPVGIGCHCCGRYWPRFTMEASETTAAWSYADGGGIAIARRVCD